MRQHDRPLFCDLQKLRKTRRQWIKISTSPPLRGTCREYIHIIGRSRPPSNDDVYNANNSPGGMLCGVSLTGVYISRSEHARDFAREINTEDSSRQNSCVFVVGASDYVRVVVFVTDKLCVHATTPGVTGLATYNFFAMSPAELST